MTSADVDIDPQAIAAIIDQLSAEHADLLPRMARLGQLAAAKSPDLLGQIEQCADHLQAPLEAHIEQEDDVLFPAYIERTGEDGVVALFVEEHRDILALRDQLLAAAREGADQARLRELAARLADLLASHMNREDMMLFPSARQALCG